MNSRIPINDELKNVAPQLINAPVAMPYTLPPDYFLHLAPYLLNIVNEETVLLTGVSKENPYSVPTGFFEGFAQSVLDKLHIENSSGLDESEESFLFSGASRKMLYEVPADYFETLPKIISAKALAPQQQSVPEGYFESLPEILLGKVRQMETRNELDEVAPLLNTISRKPVQYVPQGYFENLQPTVPVARVQNTPRVISIKKETSWFKYAVAASVAIMLSFGAYFMFNSKKNVEPSIANQPTATVINDQLASLDASTIENYLQTSNSTTITPAVSIDELNELNNADLDKMLQQFSDQQLKKYIEETPVLPSMSNSKKS
jgi:hypothetical protein